MRIAVIGSGVSGSVIARLLHSRHEVVLYEAGSYVGGHANTVCVPIEGRQVWADTGFMVFNHRTYPNFCRLLDMLGVVSQPSDMSFSVHCERTNLEYQGSSLNGLFAQRTNLLNLGFYKLIADILRFNKLGTEAALAYLGGGEGPDETVGQFLKRSRLGTAFIGQYLVPMAAAIWSSQPAAILGFPARFMLCFFHNHGLMQIADRPQWRTISDGSRNYLRKLLGPLAGQIRLNCPVFRIHRDESSVRVVSQHGEESYDQVVLATHADQSLALLAEPTEAEQRVLGQFPYQANEAVLHTDTRLLPKRSRAWASWNYRIKKSSDNGAAIVTYDLNRLQKLGLSSPLLLTLNDTASIDPAKVIQHFIYHHPAYGASSAHAQRHHAMISDIRFRTHYCGAYWGYGFHEDGVNSALAVARHFDCDLESCTVVSSKAPSAIAALSQ